MVDKIYSETIRMGFGGHKQDAYFGDNEMRTIVSDYFRSLTLRRNPNLWQSLPAERQHELEGSPEWTSLEYELEALSLVPEDSAVKNRRRALNKQKRKLVDCELAKFRRLQPTTKRYLSVCAPLCLNGIAWPIHYSP